MIRIVQPMRIDKMCVNRSDSVRLRIHHIRKGLDAARDVHGNRRTRIISGGKHKSIQQLLQGKHIPRLNAAEGGA